MPIALLRIFVPALIAMAASSGAQAQFQGPVTGGGPVPGPTAGGGPFSGPDGPATGSANGAVGQWACQMSYTELDQWGNRTSGFTQEYMIAVHGNGTYEAGGTLMGASGISQFQSQGSWQLAGQQFFAQGPQQTTYGTEGMFGSMGTLAPDGLSMMLNYEQPDPSGSYVMNRSNYICERRG